MAMTEQEYESMTKLVAACHKMLDRIKTLENKVKALEDKYK